MNRQRQAAVLLVLQRQAAALLSLRRQAAALLNLQLGAAALGLLAVSSAQAGRPLYTDDAGILPQGACQLETWLQTGIQPAQWVLGPACNPHGPIEWGATLIVQKAPAEDRQHSRQDQFGLAAKTVFKELEVGSWGVGASLGFTRPLPGNQGPLGSRLIAAGSLLFSASPTAKLTLHLNAGAIQPEGRHAVANWGTAFEYIIDERWTLVGEHYGERHGRPFTALGAAVWLVRDKVQLDATFGREPRAGGSGYARYGTLGLVWVWENVLPAP